MLTTMKTTSEALNNVSSSYSSSVVEVAVDCNKNKDTQLDKGKEKLEEQYIMENSEYEKEYSDDDDDEVDENGKGHFHFSSDSEMYPVQAIRLVVVIVLTVVTIAIVVNAMWIRPLRVTPQLRCDAVAAVTTTAILRLHQTVIVVTDEVLETDKIAILWHNCGCRPKIRLLALQITYSHSEQNYELGWPESANTWEPLEHLSYVPDIIEAFEQSSGSGKQRKRRRANVYHHAEFKKRQERCNTPYSLRHIPRTTADNHTQSAPLNDHTLTDPCAFPQPVLFADVLENKGDSSSLGQAETSNGCRSSNPRELSNGNEENDYDPKLSELKAATTSRHGADKPTIHYREGKVAAEIDQMNGHSKGVSAEQVESDHSRGVKRKKSGSAKKLKEDSLASEPVNGEQPISTSAGTFESTRTENIHHAGNNSKKKTVLVKPICNIIKILKPLGCSPTVSGKNISVTFMALSSSSTTSNVSATALALTEQSYEESIVQKLSV
ncbi:hypothetical protein Lal_00012048 [Lupinus albus]|nr:hypothetical protein Lal_00012048 [Lupinus albus]